MGKNHKPFFTKHNLKEKKEDPIKELMALYQEKDISGKKKNDKAINSKDDEHALQNIIEKNRKRSRRKTIIFSLFILFILAGSATAGFFYFSRNPIFNQQTVALEIQGPDKVKLGESFEYHLKFKNEGQIDIAKGKVIIQYPQGFNIEKTNPEATDHSWDFADLKAGQSSEIVITGYIINDLAVEEKLTAILQYTPVNFNSEFSKEASFSMILDKPDLELIPNTSPTVTLGQKITLGLKIKNKEKRDFKNIKLVINYPTNFQIQNAKPNYFQDNNKWIIPEIKAESEGDYLSFEGQFPSDMKIENDNDRNKEFVAQIFVSDVDSQFYQIGEQKFSIKIIDQALTAYLIVNGSTENKNIQLGDLLTFSTVVKNNGEEAYKDLTVKTIISYDPLDILDWEKIDDAKYGKIQKTKNSKEIIWTKTQIPELANFETKNEQMITFSLPIKTLEQFKNTNIDSIAQSKLKIISQIILPTITTEINPPIESSPVELTLNSDANLDVKALYYYDDGTPLGTGPLPPQVGKTTKLQIFWTLTNHLHEISDITVSTILPDNIAWVGENQAGSGDITYNDNTKTITWKINRLPKSINEAKANFAINITPTKEDKGKIMKLTGVTTLSARDVDTEELIVKTKNIITSALENDDNYDGSGLVQ